MGLLDQVIGAAIGGGTNAGNAQGSMNAMLLQQLIAFLSRPNALGSLTAAASQQQGLASIIQSWIGSGQNLPISGSQLQQILGANTVADMAERAGMGVPEASAALSKLLPQLVDKATPEGRAPASGDLGALLSSVGKLVN